MRRGARKQWAAIALAIALVAAAGTGIVDVLLRVSAGSGDRRRRAPQSAVKAASDGTVALLSYSPESLDKDFATAKSKLTGSFLSYYTQFTEQIVAPAAKQKSVKTKASVVRAAVSEIHPDTRGRAGVHQPDHRKRGPARRKLHQQRRAGHHAEGRRRLAHLVLRPGVAPCTAVRVVDLGDLPTCPPRADRGATGGRIRRRHRVIARATVVAARHPHPDRRPDGRPPRRHRRVDCGRDRRADHPRRDPGRRRPPCVTTYCGRSIRPRPRWPG